jgi:photosystem II stability/assembly factor-like uncharacterized protein
MKFCTLLLLLTYMGCLVAIGQPIQKHGPSEVYYVEDFVEGKNERLFLSATGGLYYTDDIGDTWQRVDAYMNSTTFHPSFATNNKNGDLYAWADNGTFSTSDNGTTWKFHIFIMPSGGIEINDLGIDGDTLFIGTKNGLYYVHGTDVVRYPTEISALQGNEVTALHVDGETVVAGTKSGKVFVSGDLGDQWEEKSNGLPGGLEVKGFLAAGSTWYVYSQLMGVYYSNDGGTNWLPKNSGFAVEQVNKIFADGDYLYAATNSYENVYRSDLAGGSWTLIDNGIPNETLPNAIYVKGNNIIVGGWHGIFKSNNGGNSYERSQTGITDAFVFRTIQVAPDGTIWAAGSHTGVYRMAPGEEIFTLFPGVVWSGNFGSSLLKGNVLPIVQDYITKLYDVEDNTWKQEYQYINIPLADKFLQTAQGIFLSSRSNGVFRYTGTTFFTPFSDGLVSLAVNDLIDIGDKMIAATEDGLYIRGAADPEWERIPFSAEGQGVRRLFIHGSLYILTANDYNVYLSNDGGETWQLVEDLKSKDVSAYAVAQNGVLYAASFAAIYVSTDSGEQWVQRDLPNAAISSIVVSGENLFIGTIEQGIWSTALKFDQQITFTNTPETVNQQSPYTLSATTTSGLPITYTVLSGPGTVEGNILTVTGEGDIVVRASQAGDDVYNPSIKEHTFLAEIITGIEDEREPVFSIYPNPVDHTINVVLGNVSENGSIRLIGPQGQTIQRRHVQGSIEIPAEHLPGGTYFLQYSNGITTTTKKIVKK